MKKNQQHHKKRGQVIEQDSVELYEKRTFTLKTKDVLVEKREANGKQVEVLTGYAAVFEQFTELADWWGDTFHEKFTSDSMDETLSDGHVIYALFNHSWRDLMGATVDNLTLEKRDEGLYFELIPKNFEFDRRIMDLVRGGTIGGCSIGFRVLDQDWEEKDGDYFRIIRKVDLYEITFTPIPAYAQTSISVDLREIDTKNNEKRSVTGQETDLEKDDLQTSAEDEERKALLEEAENTLKQFS
ncbi:HK97 family phage prohead protease [Mesobacillus subterraneus]|uniref:HK97 family phage prohead protease n=1 Tax=Mesobacillus subterraneus TaxID=285983 RepID=A0A427TDR2_9BACI|nr:HK97 family phage prohead protease [Mesobacillus subterraneus]RSD21070.1 HK97 family phage prohead protease [Mesobacillus subterraneus]